MTEFNYIPLTNVVTVQQALSPSALTNFSTSNLAMFTKETPVVSLPDGYAIYKDASSVESDWGTDSEAFLQASAVFAQQPNLLNGSGSLIIFQMENSTATHGTFTTSNISLNVSNFATLANGALKINVDGADYVTVHGINFGATPTLATIASTLELAFSTQSSGIFITPNLTANVDNFDGVTTGAFKIVVDGAAAVAISSLTFGSTPTLQDIVDVINAELVAQSVDAVASVSGETIVFTSDGTGSTSSIVLTSPTSGIDITGANYLNIAEGITTDGHDDLGVSVSVVGGTIVFTSDSTGASSSIGIQAPLYGTNITTSTYLDIVNGVAIAGHASGAFETLTAAIARTQIIQYYAGILACYDVASELPALANYVQTLDKILFIAEESVSLLDSGIFADIYAAGNNHTKCLLHTISTKQDARIMAAAFASVLLSTNFEASKSTLNMNLQSLVSILPSSYTQTQITKAAAIGVDIYGAFANGVNKMLNSKNVDFIDSIYNDIALKLQLQVSYFNTLATAGTKIPQTEDGMSLIKDGLTKIFKKFVTNQAIAPGTWTSPNTFGNPTTFKRNIEENGYYIYSQPVALQDPTDRENRIAPVIQYAFKRAGAINKGNVLGIVNN